MAAESFGQTMKAVADPARLTTDEAVTIPAAGVHLEGDLRVPHAAAGIVLFAHGSGSSRHSPRNQFVAQVIRESGLGTLLFDLLTRAEERQDAATGHLRFDIDLLADRLTAATHWLAAEPVATGKRLGCFGASTGAAAALIAATQPETQIAAVVSRGGRPDLAGAALAQVQCPTLLIVGGNDPLVYDLNLAAFDRLRCTKELRIVEGASHLFEEPGKLEQVAQWSAQWFGKHLDGMMSSCWGCQEEACRWRAKWPARSGRRWM
jgi:putative phosphoribosyl transferase